jgi:8-oxo-dGTP pyrophosphatase MutT (NUDIX family)
LFDPGLQKKLKAALALDLPYSHQDQRMLLEKLKPNPVPAAVLILFALDGEVPFVLYMLRTQTVLAHKGQISFPGGVTDPEDEGNPNRTALRETYEEVGIDPTRVQALGELPPLLTVTGFEIRPVVGITDVPLRELELKINPAEVAEVLWVGLDELMLPETYRHETLVHDGISFLIDVYLIRELNERRSHRIWGATGSITKNLVDRLNTLQTGVRKK